MKFNLKIFLSILIVFYSFNIHKIKAHNSGNGGCKNHCSIIKNKGKEKKIKILKKNKKLFIEKNSCVNNYLCRG